MPRLRPWLAELWRPERGQQLVGNGELGSWLHFDFLAAWPQQPALVAGAAKTGIGLVDGIGKQPITALVA